MGQDEPLGRARAPLPAVLDVTTDERFTGGRLAELTAGSLRALFDSSRPPTDPER